MKPLVTILLAVVAAAAVSAWIASGGTSVPAAPVGEATADGDTGAAAGPPVATAGEPGWRRLERAIERLGERIAALEQRLAQTGTGPLRVDAAPATATIDVEQLRRALDQVAAQRQHERFAAFGDAELLHEVQTLLNGKDLAAADAALRELTARELDGDTRDHASIQLGLLQRQRGEHEAAARTLQAVVDARGMRDKAGAWAGYQLAWTLRERDPAGARHVAERLSTEAADAGTRVRARWTAARFSEELGDVARARADYGTLLAELGDGKEFADVVKDVRWRLSQLDGR